jgi:hypothetical protein
MKLNNGQSQALTIQIRKHLLLRTRSNWPKGGMIETFCILIWMLVIQVHAILKMYQTTQGLSILLNVNHI